VAESIRCISKAESMKMSARDWSGAREEVAHAKNHDGLETTLGTVKEIIEE
jgi:hypothetical protein